MQEKLILAIAIIAIGFLGGWNINGWRLGKQMAELERDIATARADAEEQRSSKSKALQSRNAAITDALLAEMGAESARSRVITKEVIRYVQNNDAGRCRLSDDWVQLHESAATGNLPDLTRSPGTVAGAAEALTDADALPVVAANYEQCRNDQARLRAWQKWYYQVANP